MEMHSNMNLEASAKQRTAAIIAKAREDDDYREQLLANPKHAIQGTSSMTRKERSPSLSIRAYRSITNYWPLA